MAGRECSLYRVKFRLGADNRLRMTPAEEVGTLRGSYYPLLAQHLKNQSSPIVGDAEAIELDLVWDMNSATAVKAMASRWGRVYESMLMRRRSG